MKITRPNLYGGIAAIVVIVVAALIYRYATSDGGMVPGAPGGQTASWSGAKELLKPGPLKEMTLGPKEAPITVIEYASMTCGHCANFSVNIFPEFKAKYIDTGKVHFIFREYPLDPLAAGAFMLARCVGEDRYFGYVEMLFEQQDSWTRTNDPVNALFNLSKQAGFTEESFDKCLANQPLLDGINAIKDRAEKLFDVDSTPTFFVNGRIARGVQTIDDFERLFAAELTN